MPWKIAFIENIELFPLTDKELQTSKNISYYSHPKQVWMTQEENELTTRTGKAQKRKNKLPCLWKGAQSHAQ